MSDLVSLKIEDGIAIMTLDDGKANALSFAMMEALNATLDEAEAKADVIILTGNSKATSAGFDLKVMQNEPDRVADMVGTGGKFLTRLFINPKPIIIASSGHGIAAGGLLMLSADYRIGAEGTALYGLNESAIGMVMPHYGLELALHKIDNKYLDASFAGAQLFDSATAVKAGYLDEVVPADQLMTTAMEKAQAMQKLDAKAFAGNKRLIRGEIALRMTGA